MKSNVVRPVSGSRLPDDDLNYGQAPRSNKNHARNYNIHGEQTSPPQQDPYHYAPAKITPPLDRLVAANKQQKEPLDLTRQQRDSKPNDTASIRIRDPVTSKVRTIYLNDDQIEELSKRHENDKHKVNNTFNSTSSNKFAEKPKVPVDTRIKYDNRLPKESIHSSDDHSNNINKESILDIYNKQQNEEPRISSTSHSNSNTVKTPVVFKSEDDAKFEQLVERHKSEKQKVNEFDASPYTVEAPDHHQYPDHSLNQTNVA